MRGLTLVAKDTNLSPWKVAKPQYFNCTSPHSFYDLIESITDQTRPGWVLHRIANLIRKADIEASYPHLTGRLEWHSKGLAAFELENKQLKSVIGGRLSSECLSLSLFSDQVDANSLETIDNKKLLVHCIIKRDHSELGTKTHIYEAIVRPCFLLNNFLNGIRTYDVTIGSRQFEMEGLYFSQQNRESAKCAQSAMAMALRALGRRTKSDNEVTPAEIIRLAPGSLGKGLELSEMVRVFKGFGINPLAVNFQDPHAVDLDYRSYVHLGIESGVPVLLCFVTRNRKKQRLDRHVVTVFGHTLNTDTWIAEAEFGYGVTTPHKYHSSYHWCPHWIISDDNLGMAYNLQANRLTSAWNQWNIQKKGNWSSRFLDWVLRMPRKLRVMNEFREFDLVGVLVPLSVPPKFDLKGAEIKVIKHLSGFNTARWKDSDAGVPFARKARWIKRLIDQFDRTHPGPGPILRTRHIGKSTYINHLRDADTTDWDGRSLDKALVDEIEKALPDNFWMTEYTLANLLTANQRKLGEVLWESRWSFSRDIADGLLLTRFPGLVKLHKGKQSTHATRCWGHIPLLSTARERS